MTDILTSGFSQLAFKTPKSYVHVWSCTRRLKDVWSASNDTQSLPWVFTKIVRSCACKKEYFTVGIYQGSKQQTIRVSTNDTRYWRYQILWGWTRDNHRDEGHIDGLIATLSDSVSIIRFHFHNFVSFIDTLPYLPTWLDFFRRFFLFL